MLLETIGQKLKTARESQGLTLRQIYEKTKIPIGHLQSIDNANAENLPEPVYVAGFIKRYADTVGLDGQTLSDDYRRSTEVSPVKDTATSNGHGHPVLVTPDRYYSNKPESRANLGFKTIYFNALCIIGVMALVYYLVNTQIQHNESMEDPSLRGLRSATPSLGLTALPTTNQPSGLSPSPTVESKLTLAAIHHVWIEVKSASTGQSLFTGYLEPGDQKAFSNTEGLRIRVGDGGSLTVAVNGKTEPFGVEGQVAERVFAQLPPPIDTNATQPATTPTATTEVTKPSREVTEPNSASTTPAPKENLSAASHPKHLDDTRSRSYSPDSSAGNRLLDVPYRYGDGRLDTE